MVSPVGGVAICHDLSVNVQHSIDDFHHQLCNLSRVILAQSTMIDYTGMPQQSCRLFQ